MEFKNRQKFINLKKKKNPPNVEREKERYKFFVRKNYAYNGRENVKFILKG